MGSTGDSAASSSGGGDTAASADESGAGTTEPLRDLGGAPDFGDGKPVGCKGKIDFLFLISREWTMHEEQQQLLASFPGCPSSPAGLIRVPHSPARSSSVDGGGLVGRGRDQLDRILCASPRELAGDPPVCLRGPSVHVEAVGGEKDALANPDIDRA